MVTHIAAITTTHHFRVCDIWDPPVLDASHLRLSCHSSQCYQAHQGSSPPNTNESTLRTVDKNLITILDEEEEN